MTKVQMPCGTIEIWADVSLSNIHIYCIYGTYTHTHTYADIAMSQMLCSAEGIDLTRCDIFYSARETAAEEQFSQLSKSASYCFQFERKFPRVSSERLIRVGSKASCQEVCIKNMYICSPAFYRVKGSKRCRKMRKGRKS